MEAATRTWLADALEAIEATGLSGKAKSRAISAALRSSAAGVGAVVASCQGSSSPDGQSDVEEGSPDPAARTHAEEVDQLLADRLACVEPALRGQFARQPIKRADKLRRNVALHADVAMGVRFHRGTGHLGPQARRTMRVHNEHIWVLSR